MDLTTVQHKTAVFFYQTTCLYLYPTSFLEINLQMTFETELTQTWFKNTSFFKKTKNLQNQQVAFWTKTENVEHFLSEMKFK